MNHGDVTPNIAKGLKELRKRIEAADIPPSILDETILLATWNIRAFGSKNRKVASLHYIAEVLGQFDLIAITEVGANLKPLAEVLDFLGPHWRVVYSDFISDDGGNSERVAYVYDERAVSFTGLASEADPPRIKNDQGEYLPAITWWRSPYIASFRAGNFDFVLVTAHVRWGDYEEDRLKPLRLLAEWVNKRRKSKNGADKDIIVMGDFNIPAVGDEYYGALTSGGLRMPDNLAGVNQGTNLSRENRYDQILHYPTHDERFHGCGGILDFYSAGIDGLYPGEGMSKQAFTYQMSDHLPLWVEVDTWIDDARLDQIINRGE